MSVKWKELGEGNQNQDKKDKGIGNWTQRSENYVEKCAQVGLWMISSSNQPRPWYMSLTGIWDA